MHHRELIKKLQNSVTLLLITFHPFMYVLCNIAQDNWITMENLWLKLLQLFLRQKTLKQRYICETLDDNKKLNQILSFMRSYIWQQLLTGALKNVCSKNFQVSSWKYVGLQLTAVKTKSLLKVLSGNFMKFFKTSLFQHSLGNLRLSYENKSQRLSR